MNIRVGCDGGADVDPDRSGVNELDLPDAFRVDSPHVRGQTSVGDFRFKRGNEALQNERGFTRTGNACDDGQPPFGNVCFQRLNGVDRSGGEVNASFAEQFRFRSAGA